MKSEKEIREMFDKCKEVEKFMADKFPTGIPSEMWIITETLKWVLE